MQSISQLALKKIVGGKYWEKYPGIDRPKWMDYVQVKPDNGGWSVEFI